MKGSPLSPDAAQRLQMNRLSNVLTRRWTRRFGRTQFLDFSEQLHIGVRYFDLRAARAAGVGAGASRRPHYRFVHGCYGGEVLPAMRTIERFLRRHTGEIALLHFQHLYAMTAEDHRRLKRSLRAVFGDLIVERAATDAAVENEAGALNSLTLASLRARGQRVMIFYSQEAADVGDIASIGDGDPVWPTRYISSPWPNTNRQAKLYRILRQQRSSPTGDSAKLRVTQCLLTLKANDIIRFTYGNPSWRE